MDGTGVCLHDLCAGKVDMLHLQVFKSRSGAREVCVFTSVIICCHDASSLMHASFQNYAQSSAFIIHDVESIMQQSVPRSAAQQPPPSVALPPPIR
jgi:hypothetical protein